MLHALKITYKINQNYIYSIKNLNNKCELSNIPKICKLAQILTPCTI